MRQGLAVGAILVCALVESNCVKYNAHPINPQILENQFRSRSLADPGLCQFVRQQSGDPALVWPPAALDLKTLIYVAFYFNPEIGVARAQAKSAEAAVLSARQRINPSLAAEGGYNKTPESTVTYGASATFTIETAGKRGYRILQAEKLAEAARIALDENAWRVRSDVRSAFAAHYFATRRLELLRSENKPPSRKREHPRETSRTRRRFPSRRFCRACSTNRNRCERAAFLKAKSRKHSPPLRRP